MADTMNDATRDACHLVMSLLDESQPISQMAKWLLEQEETIQATLDI